MARVRVREKPLTQPAAWPWRLPIIRHVRYLVCLYRVNRHYENWAAIGALETTDFDRLCLDQIWRGVV
jgi:hypothetical protein